MGAAWPEGGQARAGERDCQAVLPVTPSIGGWDPLPAPTRPRLQAEHDLQLRELRAAHDRREKELSRRVSQLEEARSILLARTGAGARAAAPAPAPAAAPAVPALLRIGLTLEYGPPHTVAAVHDLRDEAGVQQASSRPSACPVE
jgi:hypothetical protein